MSVRIVIFIYDLEIIAIINVHTIMYIYIYIYIQRTDKAVFLGIYSFDGDL